MRARQKREREREGDNGSVYLSTASPGATAGVKLLTRMWTAVLAVWELHQGNGKQGFHYGPRCIVGGERQGNFGEMKAEGERR